MSSWTTQFEDPEATARAAVRGRFETQARRPDAEIDLERAALLISAEADPSVDVDICLGELDSMGAVVAERIEGLRPGLDCLTVLTRYLAEECGLQGDRENYYDPANSYLDQVLARRRGIPISLAIIYMAVGRRAGVSLQGVGFPGHFLLRHEAGPGEVEPIFVDPFHGGRILGIEGCRALLEQVSGGRVRFERRYLEATSARMILVRMLNNLKAIHLEAERHDEALQAVDRIVLLLPESMSQRRDRGLLRLRAGAFGAAREDLLAYLAARPDAEDQDTVAFAIAEAGRRLAELN